MYMWVIVREHIEKTRKADGSWSLQRSILFKRSELSSVYLVQSNLLLKVVRILAAGAHLGRIPPECSTRQ